MKNAYCISVITLLMAGCGGGAEDSKTYQGSAFSGAAPSLSARPLADNTVRLTLGGFNAPGDRYCIRQDALVPPANDACFADADSSLLTQHKSINAPSDTQRITLTAWVRRSGVVSQHASISIPGRTCSNAAYATLAANSLPAVCLITGTGTLTYESVLLLESVKAPNSASNFLRYVNQGFYDQTVFHRFLKGGAEVVQGGNYAHTNGGYVERPANLSAIALESTLLTGLSNQAGTIAMARTDQADSATAGFFINTTDNSSNFDSKTYTDGYAVFGRFIHGAEAWKNLLAAVEGTGEILRPATVVRLYWAYQIQ
jgi:cyclophilin family peptidyl-prolyl cis-trans isomerase